MGTQSSLCRPGACSMLALAVISLLVCANGSRLPASSEQVMPKLHLAYLVEDVEYPRPEGLQASNEELPYSSRVKRQESSFLAVNEGEAREEAEHQETEKDAETFATASETPPGRNAALSAAILRVLKIAGAEPTPVDPTGSYSGRRRRSAQQQEQVVNSNDAETFATASASATPGRNAALSAAILNVLTDTTTEDQIVQFFKEICHTLGSVMGSPTLEAECNAMFESNLPQIIDDLVNQNLDPVTVCTNIGLCP